MPPKKLVNVSDVKDLLMGLDELPWEENVGDLVDSLPTVDAVEVVHGQCDKSVMKDEWYGHIYTCKECKYQCMVDDGTGNEVAPNYCPNCGAKMDGDSDAT